MKANELRIGNWAMGNSPFKVDGNAIHMAQIVEKVNSGEERFGSIPLTEEILLKAGFELPKTFTVIKSFSKSISWSGGDYKTISVCTDTGNQYIYLRHGELNGIREEDDLICVFNGDVNGIIYVHQLQNLYFALTGEELEITL